MKRQALTTSPKELRKLADELENEAIELNESLNVQEPKSEVEDRAFSLAIINKTPECSDTWQFERDSQSSVKKKEVQDGEI